MDVGTIIFIVVLVIVMPVGVLMSMAGLAGVFGTLIGRNSDLDNVGEDGEPNEYLTLSDATPTTAPSPTDRPRCGAHAAGYGVRPGSATRHHDLAMPRCERERSPIANSGRIKVPDREVHVDTVVNAACRCQPLPW